jgi:hypothetical protein
MTISFTSYFEEQVLRKRPYIKKEWCIEAVQSPVKKVVQKDGRIRYWIYVPEMAKYLRVITL